MAISTRLIVLASLVYLEALMSASAAAVPSAAPGNLIPDPTFSTRSAQSVWTIGGLSGKPGELHFEQGRGPNGSTALVTRVSSGAFAISAPIEVTPQAVYTMSVFLDSRGNTSNGNVAFYIRDAKTTQIYQGYPTTEGANGRVVFPSWTAPRGATSIQIIYAINSTGVTGNIVFAQPEFRVGTYAPAQPVAALVIAAPQPAQAQSPASERSKWLPLIFLIAVVGLITISIAALNYFIINVAKKRARSSEIS